MPRFLWIFTPDKKILVPLRENSFYNDTEHVIPTMEVLPCGDALH